jgi:hypothetical protein
VEVGSGEPNTATRHDHTHNQRTTTQFDTAIVFSKTYFKSKSTNEHKNNQPTHQQPNQQPTNHQPTYIHQPTPLHPHPPSRPNTTTEPIQSSTTQHY